MPSKRNILLCAEDTAAAAVACEWALRNVYREGDVIHLTAIVKCLLPDMEVFHSAPGTAFSFKQPEEHREQELIGSAKAQIEARYLPLLRSTCSNPVPYELHLYAERTDAPESRVAELILKDIEQRDADLVVLAACNQAGRGGTKLGSVALGVSKGCVRPVAIVRPRQ